VKQEIIEMARQAGFDEHHAKFDTRMEAFAKLVAAKEREACARLFDKRDTGTGFYEPHEPAEIIRAGDKA